MAASEPTSVLSGSMQGSAGPSSTVTLWVSEAVAPPLSVTGTPTGSLSRPRSTKARTGEDEERTPAELSGSC